MENQNPSESEKKIRLTLESLDGISRQKTSEQLKIKLSSIPLMNPKIRMLSPQIVWKVAASIAILIGLNVFTILSMHKKSNRTDSASTPFANEYFSYLNVSSIGI